MTNFDNIFDIDVEGKFVDHNDLCTQGRLNRMFKYFRNKLVQIRFEYNNSMGYHSVRESTLKYDQFTIITVGDFFNAILTSKGETVFEQDFNVWYEFVGLGSLKYCNSGPYCYFTMKRKKLFGLF